MISNMENIDTIALLYAKLWNLLHQLKAKLKLGASGNKE